jgi:hypothetical protein
LAACVTLVGCTAEQPANQEAGPSEPHVERVDFVTVRFRAERELQHRAEYAGLTLLLLEGGIAELANVVPVIDGGPPPPSLGSAVDPEGRAWILSLEDRGDDAVVRLSGELCRVASNDRCAPLSGSADRAKLESAVASVVRGVAVRLGRTVLPPLRAIWVRPVSKDPYARLITGRAAAVLYGLHPPSDAPNDRRKDPLARATFLDPTIDLAHWLDGRARFLRKELTEACAAFERAAILGRGRVIMRADLAHCRAASGARDALSDWNDVPNELRFALGRIESAVAVQAHDPARKGLDALPERYRDSARVLELEVALRDAAGRGVDVEALLERWQRASPFDPTPVLRRARLALLSARYEDAAALASELEKRGLAQDARRIGLAAELGLRDLDQALALAAMLEERELAHRIWVRGQIESKTSTLTDTKIPDPMLLVSIGEARLAKGEAASAVSLAERALAFDPFLPEALSLAMRAYESAGDPGGAIRAAELLARAEPSQRPGGPRTAPAATGSGRQSHARTP